MTMNSRVWLSCCENLHHSFLYSFSILKNQEDWAKIRILCIRLLCTNFFLLFYFQLMPLNQPVLIILQWSHCHNLVLFTSLHLLHVYVVRCTFLLHLKIFLILARMEFLSSRPWGCGWSSDWTRPVYLLTGAPAHRCGDSLSLSISGALQGSLGYPFVCKRTFVCCQPPLIR